MVQVVEKIRGCFWSSGQNKDAFCSLPSYPSRDRIMKRSVGRDGASFIIISWVLIWLILCTISPSNNKKSSYLAEYRFMSMTALIYYFMGHQELEKKL